MLFTLPSQFYLIPVKVLCTFCLLVVCNTIILYMAILLVIPPTHAVFAHQGLVIAIDSNPYMLLSGLFRTIRDFFCKKSFKTESFLFGTSNWVLTLANDVLI